MMLIAKMKDNFIDRFKDRFLHEEGQMSDRLQSVLQTFLTWLPVGLIGIYAFYYATAEVPTGTLLDMRIKLLMYLGKSFMAVYIGQILWSLLFPVIDLGWSCLQKRDKPLIAFHHQMYGRLLLHSIMQYVIVNV